MKHKELADLFEKMADILEFKSENSFKISAYSERLDLGDIHCRKAKEMGIRVAIGTDSHHLDHMWMMSLGVAVARRGWLETKDILNALSLKELLKWCHRS
jgi:DNA polymerase (family 10)